jgi:D-alanine transaminase
LRREDSARRISGSASREREGVSRIVYVNGRYKPAPEALVPVDDRAFTFGDGVYEVCEVSEGFLIEEGRHLDRLGRSLHAVRMDWPTGREALRFVMREILRLNRVGDGLVYLQVSRGVARRDHGFPPRTVRPTLMVAARALDPSVIAARAAAGVAVITVPETRWAHPHIKTLQLLPNVLAKQAARDAGAFEAWFVDRDGFVTEGASTNAWIVARNGALVTRQADDSILHGVTRAALIDVAAALGLRVVERPFSPDEAKAAREAFVSSATTIATPVVMIDGIAIGNGGPGPVTLGLRGAFRERAARS